MASYYDQMILDRLHDARPGSKGIMRLHCPFCATRVGVESRQRKFWIFPHSGKYGCWKCKIYGRLRETPEEWENLPGYDKEEEVQTIEAPEGFLYLGQEPAWSSVDAMAPIEYAMERGVSADLIWEARLGYCPKPEDWRLKKRIIIPILGTDGETWMGYVARRWYKKKGDPLPYLYSDDLIRRLVLYNAQALLVTTDIPVLVVEGAFDALYYWPHAVATLGTFSDEQVDLLAGAKRPVCIVMDGDAADVGLGMAKKLFDMGHVAGAVRLPPGKDPDQVDKDWLLEQAEIAIDLGPL